MQNIPAGHTDPRGFFFSISCYKKAYVAALAQLVEHLVVVQVVVGSSPTGRPSQKNAARRFSALATTNRRLAEPHWSHLYMHHTHVDLA